MDLDAPAPAVTCGGTVGVSAAQQSPQKLLPVGLSPPHVGQRKNSGAPQSPQTFVPSGSTLPQFGQSMPHPI